MEWYEWVCWVVAGAAVLWVFMQPWGVPWEELDELDRDEGLR